MQSNPTIPLDANPSESSDSPEAIPAESGDRKRLRRVFKGCRNFGDHLQFSSFECDLNPSEKVQMERELTEIIHHGEDQVLFVTLGPAESRDDRVILPSTPAKPPLAGSRGSACIRTSWKGYPTALT
jgi:CRISPR-associated protein Cas2